MKGCGIGARIEYVEDEGEDAEEEASDEEEGDGVSRGVDSDGGAVRVADEVCPESPVIDRASFSRDMISGWVCG